MTTDHWAEAAFTNDEMVAELLLGLKRSSYSDSLNAPPPSTSVTQTKGFKLPYWGHRKNRSKHTAAISAVTNGIGKEQRRSPTTHLSWSGGGGSTSDESSRPSDLSSGGRSVKANEGASTSSYNKFHKRKELASTSVTMNQEMGTSENMKRIKVTKALKISFKVNSKVEKKHNQLMPLDSQIDFDQNRRKEIGRMVEDDRKKKATIAQSCRVEAENERGFVLPDLNMMPNEEDGAMMI